MYASGQLASVALLGLEWESWFSKCFPFTSSFPVLSTINPIGEWAQPSSGPRLDHNTTWEISGTYVQSSECVLYSYEYFAGAKSNVTCRQNIFKKRLVAYIQVSLRCMQFTTNRHTWREKPSTPQTLQTALQNDDFGMETYEDRTDKDVIIKAGFKIIFAFSLL